MPATASNLAGTAGNNKGWVHLFGWMQIIQW